MPLTASIVLMILITFKLISHCFSFLSFFPLLAFHQLPGRRLTLPLPPPPNSLQHINQGNKHRHLDQRPHRTSKRLTTLSPINSNNNGNGQLEIIARRRETLRAAHSVPEAAFPAHPDGEGEDCDEVDEERGGDAEDAGYTVDDAVALGGEEHDDCVEEAD